jgi:hypothetical protein
MALAGLPNYNPPTLLGNPDDGDPRLLYKIDDAASSF